MARGGSSSQTNCSNWRWGFQFPNVEMLVLVRALVLELVLERRKG
jgi:hypothetical protein